MFCVQSHSNLLHFCIFSLKKNPQQQKTHKKQTKKKKITKKKHIQNTENLEPSSKPNSLVQQDK